MKEFMPRVVATPFEYRARHVKSVSLEKTNLHKQRKEGMKSRHDFRITDVEVFDKDQRTIDGICSPKYGSNPMEDDCLSDAYRCNCGKTIGAINEGDACPICESIVKFQDTDLSITGWIILEKYKIINPACYQDIAALIGGTNLDKILKFDKKVTLRGNIDYSNVKKSKANPFEGIGLIEFYHRFDEITEYFANRNKQKKEFYNMIQKFRKSIFTDSIPLFHASLRQEIKVEENVKRQDVNKTYLKMVRYSKELNQDISELDDKELNTLNILYDMNMCFIDVYKYVIDEVLPKKKGLIRKHIIAAKLDFSTRDVIIPDATLLSDEVDLPYCACMELLQGEILNMLCRIDHITMSEAQIIYDRAFKDFDKRMHKLITHIIEKSEVRPRVIINRPPTLNLGSILMVKIRKCKDEYEDFTMSVSPNILGLLAGDFDGDALLALIIKDHRIVEVFEPIFSPRFLFISRITGNYDEDRNFIKDQAVILTNLWEISKIDEDICIVVKEGCA
jgi:DNA-directed RNA polymerase beta' subunit